MRILFVLILTLFTAVSCTTADDDSAAELDEVSGGASIRLAGGDTANVGDTVPDADAQVDDDAQTGDDSRADDDSQSDDAANGDAGTTDGDRIPSRYVGRWDASAGACARSTNEMRLTISPDRMQFYEGSGAVASIEPANGGVRVLLDMQAEGTSFQRAYTLTLNAAGDRLTAATENSSAVRVRCGS